MENSYRCVISRPNSASNTDINPNFQRSSSRCLKSRSTESRNRFGSSSADPMGHLTASTSSMTRSTNVQPSSDPFPYPDPLPTWFADGGPESGVLAVNRSHSDDPEVAFLRRICRLARLEGATKRQEDRRASSALGRCSATKRRIVERQPPAFRRLSANATILASRPESTTSRPNTPGRRRSQPVVRQGLTPATCVATALEDEEDEEREVVSAPRGFRPAPVSASFGRLLTRRVIAPCPGPASSMLIRLDPSSGQEAKPTAQLRYVGASERSVGKGRNSAVVLGSGFRSYPSRAEVAGRSNL